MHGREYQKARSAQRPAFHNSNVKKELRFSCFDANVYAKNLLGSGCMKYFIFVRLFLFRINTGATFDTKTAVEGHQRSAPTSAPHEDSVIIALIIFLGHSIKCNVVNQSHSKPQCRCSTQHKCHDRGWLPILCISFV